MATYRERKLLEWESLASDLNMASTAPFTSTAPSMPPEVSSATPFDGMTGSKRPQVKLPGSQPITRSEFKSSSGKQLLKRKCEDEPTSARVVRKKISEAPRSSGRITSVVVGLETFYVHTKLLTQFSQLAELSSEIVSVVDGFITLKGCYPEVFQVFQHFLYTGQIYSSKEDDLESNPSVGEYPSDSEWTRLIESWILAHHIQSTAFKDACTDAFIAKINETDTCPTDAYTAIYSKDDNAGDCGMKRLCVDLVVWSWNEVTIADRKDDRSSFAEFWFDVAVALHKVKDSGRSKSAPYMTEGTCYYHDHGDEPCYKTMF